MQRGFVDTVAFKVLAMMIADSTMILLKKYPDRY